MESVRIERLAAHDLLNLAPFELELNSQLTIVHGDNAQGKTNLIEAAYLALRLAPFRRKRNRDLVRIGSEWAGLQADVLLPSGRRQVSLVLRGDTRTARIDGKPPSRVPGFKSEALVVLFVPDDLLMIKGQPSLRRAYLDNAIAKLYGRYPALLADYRKAVLQKNRLLASRSASDEMVAVWNARQVELGAKIVAARGRFVRRFNRAFAEIFAEVSDSDVTASILYRPRLDDVEELEGRALREAFQVVLANHLDQERAAGRTLYGPHLDTVEFLVDGRPAATYASQGQQRILVLSLKFLELRLVLEERGVVPLFLLDDVSSELDATRNALLMRKVLGVGCQVLLTTTSTDYVPLQPGSDVCYLGIAEGRIGRKG